MTDLQQPLHPLPAPQILDAEEIVANAATDARGGEGGEAVAVAAQTETNPRFTLSSHGSVGADENDPGLNQSKVGNELRSHDAAEDLEDVGTDEAADGDSVEKDDDEDNPTFPVVTDGEKRKRKKRRRKNS